MSAAHDRSLDRELVGPASRRFPGVHLSLFRGELSGELSAAEQAVLVLRDGPRRDEWIRGRLALRQALVAALGPEGSGVSVLVDPDGAPRPEGGPPCAVSLSHDGDWIAVGVIAGAAWRVGVDLCLRSHAARVSRVLGRLSVAAGGIDERSEATGGGNPAGFAGRARDGVPRGIDPCAQWAALEATLKLRRLSVMALREHAIEIREAGTELEVRGLGAAATVELHHAPEHVVAWTAERA
jgi:hypothetical protein